MIYNKHRPKKFYEVVGQQSSRTLLRQSQLERFVHTYLFYGQSGSGKTTCARLLSMSLLCQNKVDGEPCGICYDCKGIQSVSNIDVIEINAGQTHRIEDILDLCSKAYLCPTNGRRKIYIIDEAHSLTKSAQNALLRLLEEPPEFLTVILCTTDEKNLLETIKSRCQCLPFPKVPKHIISEYLKVIAQVENIVLDELAYEPIAERSNGNVRTALTLLDEAFCLVS